jgi:hypothetical protein
MKHEEFIKKYCVEVISNKWCCGAVELAGFYTKGENGYAFEYINTDEHKADLREWLEKYERVFPCIVTAILNDTEVDNGIGEVLEYFGFKEVAIAQNYTKKCHLYVRTG